jgi:TolB-like protein/DNA-binding winged helix-turn-helix (wHTH) protein/tetratricopeptide (TPR) repeat protein
VATTSNKGPAPGADHRTYLFGAFVLDIDRGALLKDGADVPLRPKCFKVLSYLVEHHGLLVTKDEVLGAVWPGVVVTEDSLTQCLIQIRKVLGDTSRDMIRTVPRRGYLFDVPVTVHTPDKSPGVPGALDSFMSGRRPSRWSVGAAIVLALAIAANWWNARIQHVKDRMPSYVQASILPGSVAVLPFVDMSPKGDQEYFGDGISEEVLNLLAQTPELTVISRTSSFSFKDQNADIETIAQKLNVASVLEGSVRMNGDQVRITAQLVKASNSAHLWSQTYDRSLDNVFAVQREIAGSVAAVLKVKLLGDGYKPVSASVSDTPNAAAYEHYLKGKFFHSRRGPGDSERAMKHYEQALEIDPNLVDAWVGLVGPMIVQAHKQEIPWVAMMTRSKALLEKALELDPNHAEAHIRLAQYYWELSDMDAAQQHYDQALRYGQNSALVLSIAAGGAHDEANFEQAIELQRRAVALDPLGFVNRGNLASFLFDAGRFDEAEVEYLNALELNPEMADQINDSLVQTLVLQQQCEEAGILIQQLPEGIARDQGMAIVHHVRGQEVEANAAIERLRADPGVEPATRLAELYAFRGDLDESFKWLASATDRILDTGRNSWDWQYLKAMLTSPFLRPLHDDPRWESWLADMETRTS